MLDWFHQFLVDKPLVRLLDIAIVWYKLFLGVWWPWSSSSNQNYVEL